MFRGQTLTHFPLFRVGACFAMSQSMARNFAAEHLD